MSQAAVAAPKGLSYVPYPGVDLETTYPPSVGERFPSADLVAAAAGLLARNDDRRPRDPGIRFHLDVSPGVVVFRESRLPPGPHDQPERGEVLGWSARSRLRMVKALGMIDYRPLFERGTPAMVTVTCPGDWLAVAPTGREFKRKFDTWRRRFERAWGVTLMCVWKLEFQARGAPHLHLFMVPPVGLCRCFCRLCGRGADPLNFRDWLSHSWASVLDHPDPAEYAKGVAAGTGVDYAEGLRATDPKRLSVYFAKHGGAGGGKEYQHQVPAEWQAEGAGPGRFWGVMHLSKVTGTAELSSDDWHMMRRTVRRWSERQSYYPPGSGVYPTRVEVRTHVVRSRRPVEVVDPASGEVTKNSRRRPVRRRHRFLAGAGGGFVMPNDGPAFVSKLARLQEAWS